MLSKALRAIAALLAVVLLIILLSSCVTAKGNGYARLMLIERYDDVSIYADTRTGVEYIVYCKGYGYGIAPVLNADGTPVLAPNFDAREDSPNGT